MIDPTRVRNIVNEVVQAPIGAVDLLLAASEIATIAAERFRTEAQAIRRELGSERARELAMNEIAEAIAKLQDSAAPAVIGYNHLLRDDDEAGIPTIE